jgi:hypothetical protein
MSGIEEFTHDFFDKASLAWHTNKTKKPNCTVVYKCTYEQKAEFICGKRVFNHDSMMCYQHRNKTPNNKDNVSIGR